MKSLQFIDHSGPLYRVVRRGWKHPLDSSFSRGRNHRWNTEEFEALYCCTSKHVARAVTLDIFRSAGVLLEDLRAEMRPQLVEIDWQGPVVDVVTPDGVRTAGFAARYPQGSTRAETQSKARNWHADGAEGVACRSASLARLRFSAWQGDYSHWSELAIYPANVSRPPKLLRRVGTLTWLSG